MSGAPDDDWIFTTAFVTVSATCTLRNAPTRFSTAERATATLGFRAPVAIEVAIALAVSWNPLVKSKPSAVTTTRTSRSKSVSTQASLCACCGGDLTEKPLSRWDSPSVHPTVGYSPVRPLH